MRAVILAIAAVLTACSVPNTQFHASAEGSGDGGGGNGPELRPSTTSVVVDEGGAATFTVQLSQAPASEVAVGIAPTSAVDGMAIALQETSLQFLPGTFDQPQTIHVDGLVDADAVDNHATIALTADGYSTVSIEVTVHDLDKVAIATDITGNQLTVNENGSTQIHVHLTHQPQSDTTVTAMAGAGPVSLTPPTLVFTSANYATDQAITVNGLDDANAVNEAIPLAFSAPSLTEVDNTLQTIDDDALNIHATPTSLHITEGTSSGVSVSLTAQPSSTVHVMVAVGQGHVGVDKTDLAFTTANWATAQTVTVSALVDADTIDNADTVTLSMTGVSSIVVNAVNVDRDVQQILTNAPNTVTIAEGGSAQFGVTLKYMPQANVTASVSSSSLSVATVNTGALTFTPANYADPTAHMVTVTGVHDNNLVTNSAMIAISEATIGTTNVAVQVSDVDTQAFVVTSTSLTVAEGSTGTFKVSLKYDPSTTQVVTIADTNATSLPISPTTINFTGGAAGNWATPVTVTLAPPVDSNAVGETATFTIHGAGAADVAVAGTVMDSTVVAQYGWPAPPAFTSSTVITAGGVLAYKITIPASTNLDSFGVYVPAATGYGRMALYADNAGSPGALLANVAASIALVNGANVFDITPDVAISTSTSQTFWVALRMSASASVSQSSTLTGTVCFRNSNITNIDDPWPSTFGAASCSTDYLLNLWINTYHQ